MTTLPTPRPAYVVFHNNQIDDPTFTYFFGDDLLTARKAAMSFAEKLFGTAAELAPVTEIEVYLVEATGPDDQAPDRIALVLQMNVSIASQVKPNPKPKPLAGFESKPVPFLIWRHRPLVELESEYLYYFRHQHSIGLGCFLIWFQLHPEISKDSATILYDAAPSALALIYLLNEAGGLLSCTYVEKAFDIDKPLPLSRL